MSGSDEFADSTDWLNTPLSSLAPLEAALRCQVCKDFFTTPMITSCSHTFCSLCIRRYLSQEGRCPACRESDQEIKLRRNWSVEEAVTQFKIGRKQLLEAARTKVQESTRTDSMRPKKRRKVDHLHSESLPERRSTRSQSKRLASQDTQMQNGYSVSSSQEEIQDSDGGSVYEDNPAQNHDSEPHDGLVACPCCGKRMKEAFINAHLDRCMAGEVSPSPTPIRRSNTPQTQTQPGSIAYGQTKPSRQNERLPTINYSMLNDNALRKKLKELGIPNLGSKELMRKRHTEWINLWNANCDSLNPVSKQHLLRDLDTWERTLGRQVDRAPNGVMVKDFDRDGWQKTNKTDFDDLIRRAREKKKQMVEQINDAKADQDGNDSLNVEHEQGQEPRTLENIFGSSGQSSIPDRANGVGGETAYDAETNHDGRATNGQFEQVTAPGAGTIKLPNGEYVEIGHMGAEEVTTTLELRDA